MSGLTRTLAELLTEVILAILRSPDPVAAAKAAKKAAAVAFVRAPKGK